LSSIKKEKKTMPNPWSANLQSYMFFLDAQPSDAPFVDLVCNATDARTNAAVTIQFTYDPTFSSALQGSVFSPDTNYYIGITSNSSLLMQAFLWALNEPGTKQFFIDGTLDPGGDTYTLTYFDFEPLALVLAYRALPEITGQTPPDVRRAIEGLQQRLLRKRA
jgi:hypothetical protein